MGSEKPCIDLTDRFQVAVRLFKKVAHEAQPSVLLMFLPHRELKKCFNDDVIYTSVLQ